MLPASLVSIFAVVFVYFGVPWIYGRSRRWVLKRRAVRSRTLVLTFDDGPGSRLTPAILNILAEYNAKATFFLLGRNIAGREGIARQIAEQGHEICSHGYDHLHYWKVSPLKALKDIKSGWKTIDAALGTDDGVYPFRPPGGKLNIVCLLYLLMRRVPIIYWTFASGDTYSAKEREKRLNSLHFAKPQGEIVLIHDFDRSDHSVDQMILDWLRSLLTLTQRNKIRLLTISELLQI